LNSSKKDFRISGLRGFYKTIFLLNNPTGNSMIAMVA